MEMETDKQLGQMGHAPCEEHGFLSLLIWRI